MDREAADRALAHVDQIMRLGLLPRDQPAIADNGRRSVVLEAAIRLFADRGFDACTMKDIAKVVGFKAPAIYNHFASKEQILAEAMESVLRSFFGSVVASAAEDPPQVRLEGVVRRHVGFQLDEPELARAIDALLGASTLERVLPGAEYRKIVAAEHAYLSLLTDLVQAHTRGDEIDEHVTALAIAAMCDRVSAWYRPGRELGRDEVLEHTWRLACRMVRGR